MTGREITVPVGQGTLRASGDLKLVSGLPLRAKAELEQVSMFQVFDRVGMGWAWVDLLATGPVSHTVVSESASANNPP